MDLAKSVTKLVYDRLRREMPANSVEMGAFKSVVIVRFKTKLMSTTIKCHPSNDGLSFSVVRTDSPISGGMDIDTGHTQSVTRNDGEWEIADTVDRICQVTLFLIGFEGSPIPARFADNPQKQG